MAKQVLAGTRIDNDAPLAIEQAGYTVTAVASGTADVQGVAAATGLVFGGFHIKEDASGTAVVTLHHGTDATGPLIGTASLAADGVLSQQLAPVKVPNGVYVNRVSGTTTLGLLTRVQTP